MKAAVYDRYGPPSVVTVAEISRPDPGPSEVLIEVAASAVSTADWRFRASDFPGGLWIFGRLMAGLRKPRQSVLGRDFAGRIVAVGEEVTKYAVGQTVFGVSLKMGAHAEFLVLPENGVMLPMPEGSAPCDAAALPFGAMSALVFLRDVARVQSGARVLITGASGGVGVYAVQIARHFGAEVTAVAGPGRGPLLQDLGAAHVLDYTAGPVARKGDRFDVIFDTVGSLSFAQAKPALASNGRFVPLEFGAQDLAGAIWSWMRGGRRMLLSVAPDRQADLAVVAEMWRDGTLRPVIDDRLPLAKIATAHARVQERHKVGSMIIDMKDVG